MYQCAGVTSLLHDLMSIWNLTVIVLPKQNRILWVSWSSSKLDLLAICSYRAVCMWWNLVVAALCVICSPWPVAVAQPCENLAIIDIIDFVDSKLLAEPMPTVNLTLRNNFRDIYKKIKTPHSPTSIWIWGLKIVVRLFRPRWIKHGVFLYIFEIYGVQARC